jgi:DNA polymerase-1
MKIIKGLPDRDARAGETVGLDIEVYQQVKPLHLPTGTFACLSVAMDDTVWLVFTTKDAKEALKRVRKGTWTLHNAMYDISHLRRWMPIKERFIWDIFLVEKHLFGGLYTRTFGLKDLARRWLNVYMDKETRDEFSTATVMTKAMEKYAAKDAWATRKIAILQKKYIQEHQIDMRSYDLVNGPAIWSFLAMKPIRVDQDKWMKASDRLSGEGRAIEEKIGINLNSPKQVKEFLDGYIPGLRRPLKNTRAETLARYGGDPFDLDDGMDLTVKGVMRGRSLIKMGTTYGESFLKTVDANGYILPGWIIDGPVTGRGACRNPNFQNVPTKEFPIFREAVIASKGNVLIISDASAQEPRIGAQLTQDPGLLRLFHTKENIYIGVAKELQGETIKKGSKRYGEFKAVVLGSFYRLTPGGLAKREHISKEAAAVLQDSFFENFSHVPIWMQRQSEWAIGRGYVETPLGRKIWMNVHDKQWQNQAVNYPIQGGAGEMTKLAMNRLLDACAASDIPYSVALQVHDELDSDVSRGLRAKYTKLKREAWMEAGKVIIPDVPLEVEFEYGSNWACK